LLYYSDGLKVKEISELLQLNKNTVLTRLARAKEQLKKEYGV
jgi:RNA polymerase sigma-70 factor (ECF subfamily)